MMRRCQTRISMPGRAPLSLLQPELIGVHLSLLTPLPSVLQSRSGCLGLKGHSFDGDHGWDGGQIW